MSNQMAERYRAAQVKVLASYPTWKSEGVLQDLANKIETRATDEFAKQVIEMAETETPIQKNIQKSVAAPCMSR